MIYEVSLHKKCIKNVKYLSLIFVQDVGFQMQNRYLSKSDFLSN